MKINKKQCFLLLMLSIIFILAIGITSATEITNETAEIIKSNEEVSTIDTQTNTINEKIIKDTDNKTKTDTYTSSNANNNNNGSTKTQPTTLTKAIDNANNGETIYLTTTSNQDTYKITNPITINKNINIIGETGKTIILDGQQKSGIFNIEGATVTLQNIQITNSKSSTAAIYSYNSDLTLNNVVFKNNEGKLAGAILSRESNIKITNSIFTDNKSEKMGGAITQLANKTLTITGSTFTRNTAKNDGGSIYSIQSKATITTSSFTQNTAENGGALYLGNNVNKIDLSVTRNLFDNNKATQKADSIWTNYHITVNNNAFVSTNNNNWVTVDKNCNNNLNSNWWSNNAPNFDIITDGVIPTNWRLLKATGKASGSTNQLTVTINSLSDSSTTTVYMPLRQVTYTADTGSFTATTQTIQNNITNTYNGNSNNIKVKIDNQEVIVNKLTDPYISINNITSTPGSSITFRIRANSAISEKVTLKVNGVTLTPTLSKGYINYSYTIPTSWKSNNYTTTLTYNGNSAYNSKTVNGYLYVKDPSIIIVPITNKEITLTTATLPKTYDLRSLNQVTSVKSQGSSGSCWAFSSLSSLESALLKKTGVSYDLSENNMKNVLKKYSVIGDSESDPNSGFNDLEPIGYLVGWYGPVDESQDVYEASSYVSSLITANMHIQDVYIIPNRNNFTDNTLIKQAIYQFGGVSTGIYKPTTTNSYTTGRDIDHSVTIVGWDDTYSRSNFSPNPPGDGAFIIKNSWGNSTGNGGYHYVSYYDESIGSVSVSSLISEQLNYVTLLENNDNYSNIYQYDVTVNALDESSLTDYLAYKNVYRTERDENIAAIGSYFLQETNYTIELYANNKLIYSQNGKVSLPGYRTIRLNQYVSIPKDEEFTVVLKMKGKDEKPVLVEYTDLYYSSIHKSTSFLSFDGSEWEDLYDYECAAPLKVYTKDTPVVASSAEEVDNKVTVTTKLTNINKSGTLTYYANGEQVKVNGKVLTQSVSKDSTVTVTFNDTTNLRNYVLTVVYSSENYALKQNISITNGLLKDTKLTVNSIGTVKIGDSVTITGTLTDESNNKLYNTKVNIAVNNKNFAVNTNSNGVYTLTYKTVSLNQNNITVTYAGNSYYSGKNVTGKFNVIKHDLKITINSISSVKYADKVVITGKVTNSTGNALANALLTIKVNSYTDKIRCNANGVFTFTRTTDTVGTNKVTVSYPGDNIYNAKSVNGTFNVAKRDTVITVNSVGTVKYSDKTTLSGKITTTSGVKLSNVLVTLTINSNSVNVRTDNYGIFKYTWKANTIGSTNLSVSFAGDSYNMKSQAKTTFKVVSMGTKITVNKIAETVYYDKAIITGKFTNDNGVGFNNSNVVITFNGVNKTVKTNSNGVYTYTVTSKIVGTNNVTVSYVGNKYYTATSKKITFKVVKKGTQISVNKISQKVYADKVTITGKFTSSTGNLLKNTNVIVKFNGVKKTVKTNSNGVYSYTVTASKVGTNNVTVYFAGNTNYKYNSTKLTFKVVKMATFVSVDKIKQTAYSDKITITGTLKNNKGTVFKYTNVTVSVNGVKKIVKTNGNGVYTLSINASKVGTNNVTVLFAGNDRYKYNGNKTTFKVVKKDTLLSLNNINTVKLGRSVTIKGKFTTNDGKVIKNSVVTLKINGVNYTCKVNANGVFTLNYKTTVKGSNSLTVVYAGNTYYKYISLKKTFVVS